MLRIAGIQSRLNHFYLAELESLRTSAALDQEQLATLSAPFLLNVDAAHAYFDAPIRVMFVGQETKGWLCRLHEVLDDGEKRLNALLARYAKALHADAGRSPFLQTRLLLEQELAGGIPGSVIWNNLFKMDVYRGKGRSRNARGYAAAVTAFSARLFRYELELLQPDVIVFGCSATHDAVLKSLFEAPQRETVRVHVPRELWHFTYGRVHCFRTLHPAVGRFRSSGTVQGHYQAIIREIKAGHHGAAGARSPAP